MARNYRPRYRPVVTIKWPRPKRVRRKIGSYASTHLYCNHTIDRQRR